MRDPEPLRLDGDAPAAIRALVRGYDARPLHEGRSDASVHRLAAPGRPAIVVKVEPLHPLAEGPGEAARLRWLEEQGVAAPRLLAEARSDGAHWIAMTEVPGASLASDASLPPERVVAIMADALRSLHALPVASCPFDHRLAERIRVAEARAAAGLVDEDDLDAERAGWSAGRLLEELHRRRPEREEPVVAHGDATTENVMARDGRFAGFVDCGRLGVADRHQDLALACRDVGARFGEPWAARLLARYGGAVDARRLDFYQLLDEFF